MRTHVFIAEPYNLEMKSLYLDEQTKELIKSYNKCYSLTNLDESDDEIDETVKNTDYSRNRATTVSVVNYRCIE